MSVKNQKEEREKKIRICPVCGSCDLIAFRMIGPQELSYWVIRNNKQFEGIANNIDCFLCKKCDHLGICQEVSINQVKNFRKNLKAHYKENQSPDKNFPVRPRISDSQKYLGLGIIFLIIINAVAYAIFRSELVLIVSIGLGILLFISYIIFRIIKGPEYNTNK